LYFGASVLSVVFADFDPAIAYDDVNPITTTIGSNLHTARMSYLLILIAL
jgi:hypothetical protein